MSQIGPDDKEHPVRYASRALQPPESKWTTREQELLAVIWACETSHRYLWGRKFFIQTDHANLQWLQAVSLQKSRLARWAMPLPSTTSNCNNAQERTMEMRTLFLDVPLLLVPPQLNLQAHLTSTI